MPLKLRVRNIFNDFVLSLQSIHYLNSISAVPPLSISEITQYGTKNQVVKRVKNLITYSIQVIIVTPNQAHEQGNVGGKKIEMAFQTFSAVTALLK